MEKIQIYRKKLQIEWKHIAKFRKYFTRFLNEKKQINIEKTNIIVFIISELLENIVKYTHDRICYLILDYEKKQNGNSLHIIIENDLKSIKNDDYKKLIEIIKYINSFSNMDEMFFELTQKQLNDDGKLNFGFALIKKLIEGNEIKITKGFLFKPGIRIHVMVNC